MQKLYFNITHEAPLCLMPFVRKLTDYDYCLVHLLPQSTEYRQFFSKKGLARDRFVLLDNSLFELGTAFEPGHYLHWIQEIEPDAYIVPDVANDSKRTEEAYKAWLDLVATIYSLDTTKWPYYLLNMIGVVQGLTVSDALACYEFFLQQPLIKKIAIPIHAQFIHDPVLQTLGTFTFPYKEDDQPRARFVKYLLSAPQFELYKKKPLHLLGCILPQEFKAYSLLPETYKQYIHSIDTSSPVVHGIFGQLYDPVFGLKEKNPIKINDIFFARDWDGFQFDSESTRVNIKYNIETFRTFLE